MKEFAKGGSTAQEQFFGYRLISARIIVECAFGRLKARLGILKKTMDLSMENILPTIMACFGLPNFCELNGERVHDDLVREAMAYDINHLENSLHTNYLIMKRVVRRTGIFL